MQLRKAERKQSKLKIGLFGPSGSGKTYSALLLAKGLIGGWDKVAVIDTENGSADLYSHLGEYNTLSLTAPYTPDRYIYAIDQCVNAGMEVVIIDSISHEWTGKGGCLEMVELATQRSASKNSYTAWGDVTPKHNAFIDKILQSQVHIITCGRTKDDVVLTQNAKGKMEPKKVGLKTVTRDGFEYEMTLAFNIDRDTHTVTADKDRTNLFEGADPFVITEETGHKLVEWANSGTPIPPEELERIALENEIRPLLPNLPRAKAEELNLRQNMPLEELKAVREQLLVS